MAMLIDALNNVTVFLLMCEPPSLSDWTFSLMESTIQGHHLREITGAVSSNARPESSSKTPFRTEMGLASWFDSRNASWKPDFVMMNACGAEFSIWPASSGKNVAPRIICEPARTERRK
jgi:hypothetical protein